MGFVGRGLAVILGLGLALVARAGEEDLLPVEQAFALKAEAVSRDRVSLHWTIADGYYLYRERIKIKKADEADTSFTLGTPEFQSGETKHDEFFGDVEVYHHEATVGLPLTAGADVTRVAINVGVQGCHEEEPKICYPPFRQTVTIDLPVATVESSPAITASDASPLSASPSNPLSTNASLGGVLGSAPASSPLGGAPATGLVDEAPLPEDRAFVFEAISTDGDGILARFTMPPGYYLYRDKTEFTVSATPAIAIGAPRWPASTPHTDEHFGQVQVFFNTAEIPLPITAAARPDTPRQVTLRAQFQGCQENGICYPPMTREVTFDLPAPSTMTATRNVPSEVPLMSETTAPLSEQDKFADSLKRGNKLWTVLLFFAVGVGLAFTPCVLPMVPILSGIIAGAGELTTRRALWLSTIYVLASAVVFTVAGVIAGLAGQNLQAILQKPAVLGAFAGVFVVLALSMFGFYELQMPSWLQNRVNNISNQQKGGSTLGVAIMGLLSALLVGPCVAPPLAGAVLYISQQRDPVFGGVALFAMALGMGAPLVAFGVSAGRLMPRAGAWMDTVKAVFGVIFLWLALWMLERVLDPVWIMLAAGMLLVISGVHLGALERLPDGASGWQRTWKALGFAMLALGVIQFIGVMSGARDPLRPLGALRMAAGASEGAEAPSLFKKVANAAELDSAIASAGGKPVLFDFYADWCVECKRMEKYTFTEPAVRQRMGDFVTLKIDVTDQTEADRALQQRFGIVGPPATLVFDCKGQEKRPLRLVGFEEGAEFVKRLERAAGC